VGWTLDCDCSLSARAWDGELNGEANDDHATHPN
jgi:hypothetical protein